MPIYTFENHKTGKQYDLEMKSDDLEYYLKKNPKVFRSFKMNIGDPVGLGTLKPPSDFSKYVLGRIKSSVPGANMDNGRFRIPKEI